MVIQASLNNVWASWNFDREVISVQPRFDHSSSSGISFFCSAEDYHLYLTIWLWKEMLRDLCCRFSCSLQMLKAVLIAKVAGIRRPGAFPFFLNNLCVSSFHCLITFLLNCLHMFSADIEYTVRGNVGHACNTIMQRLLWQQVYNVESAISGWLFLLCRWISHYLVTAARGSRWRMPLKPTVLDLRALHLFAF